MKSRIIIIIFLCFTAFPSLESKLRFLLDDIKKTTKIEATGIFKPVPEFVKDRFGINLDINKTPDTSLKPNLRTLLRDDIKKTITNVKIKTEGIIKAVPEFVHDSFGNILDINKISVVPWMKVPDIIKKENYPSESHYVTTRDGYILNIHRIPFGKNYSSNYSVVYLQHGILGSSSDWSLMGAEKGLAYKLADNGYDVWMGNVRGNLYSRNHTTLSPESKEFWNFSWHEIGVIDIPTIIDYILEKTGSKSLYHVGHSQGTTTFYVMASEKPEYNHKIRAHISLAPIAFMNNIYSPLLRLVAVGTTIFRNTLTLIGKYEFLPKAGFLSKLSQTVCSQGIGKVLCKNALFAIAGFSPTQMNVSSIPLIMAHYPAGAATKQIAHYGQEIKSGNFQQFNYGVYNYWRYKSKSPPHYNLGKITAPVHLIYGSNDWLAANSDVEKLFRKLPNAKELYNIPIQTWNHLDFIFGNDAPKIINDKVLQILSMYK